ncbi:MAG: HAD family hydrolase [Bacteriovoracaceae bacterium]
MTKHIVFDCDGTLLNTREAKYSLYPGIKELLKELTSKNLLYIWTARDRASVLRVLKDLEVIHYFENTWTVDDGLAKPHIFGLVQMLGKTSKEAICVIGDSSQDMLGAKNFNVLAIGAIWNTETKAQTLKDAGADFIVSHPSECSSIIQLNLKAES